MSQRLRGKKLNEILPIAADVQSCRCVPLVMPMGNPIVYDNLDHRPEAYESFSLRLKGYFWTEVEPRWDASTKGWNDVLTMGAYVDAKNGMSYIFGERQAPIVVPELLRCGYVELDDKAPHIPGCGGEWPIDDKIMDRLKRAEAFPIPDEEECEEE